MVNSSDYSETKNIDSEKNKKIDNIDKYDLAKLEGTKNREAVWEK